MKCIFKGIGQTEKKVKSMPSIRWSGGGKPHEFREPQVIQSVIHSSEIGKGKEE